MTDLETRHPEFTIALRGYDRGQVDDYIEYLQRLVLDAEARAREAETEYVFDEHATVGPRVAEIFALADAEARGLRAQVNEEARELLGKAREEGRAIVESAERAAREVKRRAQRDQEEIVAEFQRDRNRIRDEAVALEQRKAEAIAEIGRLRDTLSEASAAGVAAAEESPTQAMPSRRPAKPERKQTSSSRAKRQLPPPPSEDATVELKALDPVPESQARSKAS